jgi:septation ring formation regulator EzrA
MKEKIVNKIDDLIDKYETLMLKIKEYEQQKRWDNEEKERQARIKKHSKEIEDAVSEIDEEITKSKDRFERVQTKFSEEE